MNGYIIHFDKDEDQMSEEEEILGAFLLVNDYRILTNEELEDVKKAIKNLQQQLKDKDEKISNVIEIIRNDTTLNPQRQRDRLINILETNKED